MASKKVLYTWAHNADEALEKISSTDDYDCDTAEEAFARSDPERQEAVFRITVEVV